MTVTQHAVSLFEVAIQSVQPTKLLPSFLSVHKGMLAIGSHAFASKEVRNIYVAGAGKASAAMAVATSNILGDSITGGLVITKDNHALPCQHIRIVEGAHPVPDEACVKAVAQTLQLLQQAGKDDLVICLISGGASALWCDLPAGIGLTHMQQTFDLLIKSGATIDEVNTIRKHLSSIKGGQLIRHCNGAAVVSLIISDVPGNDMQVIASGPTVADSTTFTDAHEILVKRGLFSRLPQPVQAHIGKGLRGEISDTPKPGDDVFRSTQNIIIGSNEIAVTSAAGMAEALGYTVFINPDTITGDAEAEAAKLVAALQTYKGKKPYCIIQGGETTVRVTGKGKGGRNQHFALAALEKMKEANETNLVVLCGGTDGTDGPTDAAGAVADGRTLAGALQKGLDIQSYLSRHDAYHFFKQTNSLLFTGATQTNVMDIMIGIVY